MSCGLLERLRRRMFNSRKRPDPTTPSSSRQDSEPTLTRTGHECVICRSRPCRRDARCIECRNAATDHDEEEASEDELGPGYDFFWYDSTWAKAATRSRRLRSPKSRHGRSPESTRRSEVATSGRHEERPSTHTFPFDDLPRELSDMILTLCTVDKVLPLPPSPEHPELGLPIRCSFRHGRVTNALLLNKRRRREYKKLVRPRTQIIFEDFFDFRWLPFHIPSPLGKQLEKIRHATFHFYGLCEFDELRDAGGSPAAEERAHDCIVFHDLLRSLSWIKTTITALPQLQTVSVRLGIFWPDECAVEYVWPESPHQPNLLRALLKYTRIEKLVQIEVYRKPEQDKAAPASEDEIQKHMWALGDPHGFYPPPLLPGIYCDHSRPAPCRGTACTRPHRPLPHDHAAFHAAAHAAHLRRDLLAARPGFSAPDAASFFLPLGGPN